ncbi:glycosyltransferase [Candidatus Chloroploca asiatica]|uniref:Glycosyltransferase 2-like domain-containing protein n=1 Tax=Candidatus Chloroploca asiatica TaxID=1506545 RepID=A0A2H3KUS6_9CHLR|nr:glycosyltransferase [Candidatus Chloroploca asiatica]PDV97627.1 hypothetical protein A9Q02_04005 [Candidatus Chloroploca asiatica]
MFHAIKVLELELTLPLVDLINLGAYRRARILVRLQGRPLGTISLEVQHGRIAATALREALLRECAWMLVGQHLQGLLNTPPTQPWTLDDLAVAPLPPVYDGPWPSVTVAVCTRDRPEAVLRCVQALLALDYPGALELIVVDNAPSDDRVQRALEPYAPHVRYVREPRPGLDWARNRALREARGDILAYTDDDVVVDRLWVRGLAQVFAQHPAVMAVTGLVEPYELETEAQLAFEHYGGFGQGYEQRWYAINRPAGQPATIYAATGKFGTGANMAYRREIFASLGGFDPALDVGTLANGGGDLDMFFRVIKAGHSLVYEPRALVWHCHRREAGQFHQQIANNGVGFYAYLVRLFLHYADERRHLLRFAVWWFCSWYLYRWGRSYVAPVNTTRDLIVAEMRGALLGLGRYQRAVRSACQMVRPDDLPARIAAFAPLPHPIYPDGLAVRVIDLAEPLQSLIDVTAYPAVRVELRQGALALGRVELVNAYQPVGRERLVEAIVAELGLKVLVEGRDPAYPEVREAAQRLVAARYGLVEPLPCAKYVASEQPTATLPDDRAVAVVVIDHGTPEDLRACLTALYAQQTGRDYTVSVVTSAVGSGVVAEMVAAFPGIRLVEVPQVGHAYTSYAELVTSQGEFVAVLDASIVPTTDWLEQLLRPFLRDEVMITTGKVVPSRLDTRVEQIFAAYDEVGQGYAQRSFDQHWLASFRRQMPPMDELGLPVNRAWRTALLAEPLGGRGQQVFAAEVIQASPRDYERVYRALRAGHSLVYVPQAYGWRRYDQRLPVLRQDVAQRTSTTLLWYLTCLIERRDLRVVYQMGFDTPRQKLRQLAGFMRSYVRGRSYAPLYLWVDEVRGILASCKAIARASCKSKAFGQRLIRPKEGTGGFNNVT